ncbi:MAG: hypothetical protein HQ568_02055, partial [Calditrichaeota bacterium]|nr:hypothetical protein [Calditrichota bacterium]
IGCEEQPLGYIYRPSTSDESSVARIASKMVSSMYDHIDMAVGFLEDASHTNRYDTILPAGWVEDYIIISSVDSTVAIDYDLTTINADRIDILDTLDNMLAIRIVLDLDTLYIHNHLDQKLQGLRFDTDPIAGAVRTPSNIEYGFNAYRNFENFRTGSYYLDIYESSHLIIEYADMDAVGDRRDPNHVQGWAEMTRAVKFEETINPGTDGEFERVYYEYPTWIIGIENFSADQFDQNSRLVIEGTFPHLDDLDYYREDHVSGIIEIGPDGTGQGELSLYGEPIVRLYFTGRSAGFNGYFTLESQDHGQKIDF